MDQYEVSKAGVQDDQMADDEIDLLELWLTICKYKKLVFTITIIATLVSIAVVFILPPQFEATTIFVPVSYDMGELFKLTKIPSKRVLESWSLAEKIVLKRKLIPLLLGDKNDSGTEKTGEISPLTEAVMALQDQVVFTKEKDGLMLVKATWDNRQTAANIANWYVEELGEYLTDEAISLVSKKNDLVQKQLAEVEYKMKTVEEALRTFSKKYPVFDISGLTTSLFSVIGVVKGQIALEEANLRILSQFQSKDNDKFALSKAKLSALRYQLRELEQGINSTLPKDGWSNITGISISDLPKLRIEYEQLKRELSIKQEYYRSLRTQLEMLKSAELTIRKMRPIKVIDRAVPPQFPSKPKKWLIVVVGAVTSLTVAIFLVFFIEFIRTAKEKREV